MADPSDSCEPTGTLHDDFKEVSSFDVAANQLTFPAVVKVPLLEFVCKERGGLVELYHTFRKASPVDPVFAAINTTGEFQFEISAGRLSEDFYTMGSGVPVPQGAEVRVYWNADEFIMEPIFTPPNRFVPRTVIARFMLSENARSLKYPLAGVRSTSRVGFSALGPLRLIFPDMASAIELKPSQGNLQVDFSNGGVALGLARTISSSAFYSRVERDSFPVVEITANQPFLYRFVYA